MRNDAIAHFGTADDSWIKETVVVSVNDVGGMKLSAPYVRYNYRGDLCRRMSLLVPQVIDIARERANDADIKIQAELANLTATNTAFGHIVFESEFDPTLFFSGRAAVAMYQSHLVSPSEKVVISSMKPSDERAARGD